MMGCGVYGRDFFLRVCFCRGYMPACWDKDVWGRVFWRLGRELAMISASAFLAKMVERENEIRWSGMRMQMMEAESLSS